MVTMQGEIYTITYSTKVYEALIANLGGPPTDRHREDVEAFLEYVIKYTGVSQMIHSAIEVIFPQYWSVSGTRKNHLLLMLRKSMALFQCFLHQGCCTFSNGEYVKFGLTELGQWFCQAKEK
ncbi:hypothetical protein ABFS82_04G016900 [Erythranthe guttata]